jgi:methylglutaconyl-CoA hydratase
MISPYVISAMGERQARRYMLSGEEFDAAEAWRTGLVHDIVEEPGLATRVGEMLGQLYTSGPRAVQTIKQLIPQSAHSPIGAGIVAETSKIIADLRATPEAQEGLSAFLEKRKPSWTEAPKAAKTPAGKRKKR